VQTPFTLVGLKDSAIGTELDGKHPTGHCVTPEGVATILACLLSDDAHSVIGLAHLVDRGIAAS
jgi:enoyl-[acyl-carrier-protein] reductase (NADH)